MGVTHWKPTHYSSPAVTTHQTTTSPTPSNTATSIQPNFFSLFGLPARPFNDEFIINLGNEMSKPYPDDPRGRSNVPSGYVYLGQFIVHDITQLQGGLDIPKSHQEPIELLRQLSNPSLELDSVYGDSPHDDTYDRIDIPLNHGGMVLGHSINPDGSLRPGTDLPRIKDTLQPLIGDKRNDENLINSQLHLQFLKLHNWFHEYLMKVYPFASPRELYNMARKQVILHYQEIVLFDFLGRLLDKEVWDYVIRRGNATFWNPAPGEQPRIPVEFSGAAMRFGHSMVLPEYSLNESEALSISDLFKMTGSGRFNSSIALPSKYVIDWRCFFNEMPNPSEPPVNFASRISDRVNLAIPKFSAETGQHFDVVAARNLRRAGQLKLPAGEDVADYLKTFSSLCQEIGFTPTYAETTHNAVINKDGRIAKVLGEKVYARHIDKIKAPLWYYILVEAKIHPDKGQRLGKIGSLIIAEVFLGLARMSKISYFHSDGGPYVRKIPRTGTHSNGSGTAKHLRMLDVVRAVNP